MSYVSHLLCQQLCTKNVSLLELNNDICVPCAFSTTIHLECLVIGA